TGRSSVPVAAPILLQWVKSSLAPPRVPVLAQHSHPDADVVAVVVIRPAADEVAVDDARLVHEDTAAALQGQFALRDRGHPPALDAPSPRRDLDAVADARDRFLRREEMAGDTEQVLVLPDVLRRPAPAEKNAQVLLRIDVAEGNVGFDRVALPLLRDGPARLHFVQHHLVPPLLWGRHDRRKAVFLEAEVRVERVDRFARVADDDQYFVHDRIRAGEEKTVACEVYSAPLRRNHR